MKNRETYPLPDIRKTVRAWLKDTEIKDIAKLYGVGSPRGRYDIMVGKVMNQAVRDAWLSRVEARQQAHRRATVTPDQINSQLLADIKELGIEDMVAGIVNNIKRIRDERDKATTAAA